MYINVVLITYFSIVRHIELKRVSCERSNLHDYARMFSVIVGDVTPEAGLILH